MGKLDYDVISVGKENVPVRKHFDKAEIELLQIEHTNLLLEADKKITELKAIKSELSGEIKNLIETAMVKRNLISAGSVMVDTLIVKVPNYETGMMDYTNPETDEVISSRRLTPDEKQLRENRLRVASDL